MVRKNTGRRVAAFAISGAAAVGVLAGCGSHSAGEASSSAGSAAGASASESGGGGSGDGQSASAVRSAYRKTADARTAKMTMSTTVGGTDGGGTTIRGSGVIDLANGASDLRMSVQGQRTEERTVDGVLYEKLPASAAKKLLPGGRTWVRIDLKKVAGGAGGMTRMADPAAPFSYVKGLSGKNVTKVGTETVNGTKTTHYKVSVDVDKLAKDSGAQAKRLKQQLGDRLPVDLWLDDQGRIRQEEVKAAVRTPAPMSPGAGGGSGASASAAQSPSAGSGSGGSAAGKKLALDSKLRFTDFGTKADVTAPPAAKTADMTGRIAGGADTGASGAGPA
ncbi:hypothetical protein [Streptomyces sp. NRRL F-5126]|uniref:hypothetical protein n=1 Tax=Streptomyces sp. NRRL F-5126 TaxID=1463857 RepID=UPI0004C4E5DD|nr:hypothetical protein [Streptomyces sp. NRRL F-5126]